MSVEGHKNVLLIASDSGVKEFADYFKSMNASMPKENALEITENQEVINTPKSNINIKKKPLHQD
jgi:hypothetical protein